MFFVSSIYGYDPISRTQATSFLSDGGVIISIWWLESIRRGNTKWYLRM